MAALKLAIDEMKAARYPLITYTPNLMPYTAPTTVPYMPYIGDPAPYTNPTITCGSEQTLSSAQTSHNMGAAFVSNTGSLCGKSF